MSQSIEQLERRIAALEQWRDGHRSEAAGSQPAEADGGLRARRSTGAASDAAALQIGRALIILGGAYLLRAITESALVPASLGVFLGLLYAVSWSVYALRAKVGANSASYYGIATALMSFPLIFEATRKFHVLEDWSAALALAAVSAVALILVWRRALMSVAWAFTAMALALPPFLMFETKSIVPFALYLIALGIATLWLGYVFEWRSLRWIAAVELNAVLFALGFLVANDNLGNVLPVTAIAVNCIAFAAYLTSFAVRTLVRGRDIIAFEIAQTLALMIVAIGGAMWIAASRGTLEVSLAAAMLLLGSASYIVSFAFIPRHFATPANFVFYSSLALMLIVAGGAFVTRGLANSILWTALALACAYLAVHFRKSSLALHAAVYLFAGFVGAGFSVRGEEALLLLFATALAATIRPIERNGTLELWTAAKVMLLVELGWISAAFLMSLVPATDPGVVAVARTAVIASLTIITAWASRFAMFSPGRLLSNPLMILLVVKLMWEDFRVGRPATLFVSLAMVGVALIVTPRLRRTTPPLPQTA